MSRPTPHSMTSPGPAPGPSKKSDFSKIAEALYSWCVKTHGPGTTFNQKELLESAVIPGNDVHILLGAAQHLADKRLFRIHEVKGGSSIAWELIAEEHAANYGDLVHDEQMVYSAIDNAGVAGLWSKTIRQKTGLHTKLAEKATKSLESKGLIKPMKSVKFPGRKMFILSSLMPSEDATGGTWYTDGTLDTELLDTMAKAIELMVAQRSWLEVKEAQELATTPEIPSPQHRKRKAPADGFDAKGKGKAKAARVDDEQPRSQSPEAHPGKIKTKDGSKSSYEAYKAGYAGYPTVADITNYFNTKKAIDTILPQTAIEQLLEVMVYDDKLEKYRRPPRANEQPDDDGQVVMFKTWKNEAEIRASNRLRDKSTSSNISRKKAASRQVELEDIGNGGITEVPCLRCPVFDICGDGGPVNAETCVYFDQWFQKMEEADQEVEMQEENRLS